MHVSRARVEEIERLYSEYGSVLLLFAAAITGERSRAQDAVHQVFLKLIEGGSLRHISDTKAYLFACVRNAALNEIKARQRHIELDLEQDWFKPMNPDRSVVLDLQRALRALPDDQRQVTVLHIWGELTFVQIADVLGVSSNTAASRYRYALGKLRDAMWAKGSSRVNF